MVVVALVPEVIVKHLIVLRIIEVFKPYQSIRIDRDHLFAHKVPRVSSGLLGGRLGIKPGVFVLELLHVDHALAVVGLEGL